MLSDSYMNMTCDVISCSLQYIVYWISELLYFLHGILVTLMLTKVNYLFLLGVWYCWAFFLVDSIIFLDPIDIDWVVWYIIKWLLIWGVLFW